MNTDRDMMLIRIIFITLVVLMVAGLTLILFYGGGSCSHVYNGRTTIVTGCN